jgi:hypothetical protein
MHPTRQLKRTALQRMTGAHDPHPLRETIEVGSVCRVFLSLGSARRPPWAAA